MAVTVFCEGHWPRGAGAGRDRRTAEAWTTRSSGGPTPRRPRAPASRRFMAQHGLRLAGRAPAALGRRTPSGTGTRCRATWAGTGPRRTARVLDALARASRGPRWFAGGRMNLADNCVRPAPRRRARRPARGDLPRRRTATVRTLTYAELAREVKRLANALTRLGVRAGRHRRHLPADVPGGGDRHPRGVAHRRGLHAVLLRLRRPGGGLAPGRLRRASVLITADAFARRGQRDPAQAAPRTRRWPPRPTVRARDRAPPDRRATCRGRPGATSGGTSWWPRSRRSARRCRSRPTIPRLIIYTSGTTGRPKGTVLTHGGFGIKNAHDCAYLFDIGAEQTACSG